MTDAKNKSRVKYSPCYYACAKFIKHTTKMKFIKKQNISYYIRTFNDDFLDTYIVDNKENLVCSRTNQTNQLDLKTNNLCGGKKISRCKNMCCDFYCKTSKKFFIQWI